jgi:hypothetical protein
MLQELTIEKIIETKFGNYHSRIFRILCSKNMVNDRNLSELSLLPIKETRIALNELFTANFVQAHELPTKEMLYEVLLGDVAQMLTLSTYQSMFNLKHRLKYELDIAWELHQRGPTLTQEEIASLDRYKLIEARIEIALLELDKTLMILNEF